MPKRLGSSFACPCTSGKPYLDCCELLHNGKKAVDAEQLMRSRYSAYVLSLEPYLLESWHLTTRPTSLDLADSPRWVGLKVLRHDVTTRDKAVVEFVARFTSATGVQKMHEASEFLFENGRWCYVGEAGSSD